MNNPKADAAARPGPTAAELVRYPCGATAIGAGAEPMPTACPIHGTNCPASPESAPRVPLAERIRQWRADDTAGYDQVIGLLCDAEEELQRLSLTCEQLQHQKGLMPDGTLRCGGCGGPHQFDTSVPSVVWNQVIRAQGLSEFLCFSCIVREFVKAGKSFTAALYKGDLGFHGVQVEVQINSQPATDAFAVQEENNALRWKIHEAEQERSNEQDCHHELHIKLHETEAERDTLRAALETLEAKWREASALSYKAAKALPARSKARAIHFNLGDEVLKHADQLRALLTPDPAKEP